MAYAWSSLGQAWVNPSKCVGYILHHVLSITVNVVVLTNNMVIAHLKCYCLSPF